VTILDFLYFILNDFLKSFVISLISGLLSHLLVLVIFTV